MSYLRHFFVIALLAIGIISNAQSASDGFSIIGKSNEGLNVRHKISKVSIERSEVTEGQTISLSGIYLPNCAGAPDLPSHSTFVALPQGATARLEISNVKTHLINNVDIIPAAQPQLDNENSLVIHEKDQKIYSQNTFYPETPFRLSNPTTIRGINVISLDAMPFQYNPVTKELLVYDEVDLKVSIEGGETEIGDTRYRTKEWDHILSDIILNFNDLPSIDYGKRLRQHYENRETGCEYMIITPDNPDFIQLADSIRMFRIAQGVPTEIFTVTDCGGNDYHAIYDFIRNAYDTWEMPPAAVELLGDHDSDGTKGIVSYTMNNHPGGDGYNPYISDHAYSDMNGNMMSDIILARITGRNFDELYHMIKKDLDYERTPPTSPDFYDKPVTAMGFQLERWFQLCSEVVNGFWENELGKHPVRLNAIYEGTPGSRWSTADNTNKIINYFGPNGTGYIPETMSHLTQWDATGEMVNDAINNGSFIVQHRDHGNEDLWGEPRYSTATIKKLKNKDLTYVMSNNCLTGRFNYSGADGCFAEAFHRHQHGALGLIAATEVSYSFVNDVYVWGVYDNMWPDFMPTYGTTHPVDFVLPAFGNAAGKYFLKQSSWTDDYVKEITYYLFHHHGDAYMNLYTEVPQTLNVEMLPVLMTGKDTYQVKADEGALICLSVGDQIIGLDNATGDLQEIAVTPQETGTEVLMTITKQNHFRYERKIKVIPAEGPYLIFNDFAINDESGNQNETADYNETCHINLSLHNVGAADIANTNITLLCDHTSVEIINGTSTFATINVNQINTVDNAFEIHFGDAIDDQEEIIFTLLMDNGSYTFQDLFKVKVNAPKFQFNQPTMTDLEGNTTDRFIKGETTLLHFNIENIGHSKSLATANTLKIKAPFAIIDESEIHTEAIEVNETKEIVFQVKMDENGMDGGILPYQINAESGSHTNISEGELLLGYTQEDFEDEELNPSIQWNLGNGSRKWHIEEGQGLDGGNCITTPQLNINQSATLTIGFESNANSVLTFFHKVSTATEDILTFSIDFDIMGEWSDESEWQKESFEIAPGKHLFKFVYKKKSDESAGDDCARIDLLQFPPMAEMILFAGDDEIICTSESYMPESYCVNGTQIQWTTNGDGQFEDATAECPIYHFGEQDIESQEVTLSITAISTLNESQQNAEVKLSLLKDLSEIKPAQPEGETTVDLNETQQSRYSTPVEDNVNYLWTLMPEDAGIMTANGNNLTIDWEESFRGEAKIEVKLSNDCGESEISEALEVLVKNSYGIGENGENGISIYPNPAHNQIIVTGISNEQIEICNPLGQVMIKANIHDNEPIDISKLQSGIYFIKSIGCGKNYLKFIKQ